MKYENMTKDQLIEILNKLPDKANEECYQLSIESAPYGVIVHDQNGKILIFNSQLKKITGYTKEDIPDIQSWLRLAYPDKKYRKIVIDNFKTISVEETPRNKEAIITRKDGQKRTCRFLSNLMPSGLRTVFISDITEQKLSEEALHESEKRYRSLFDLLPYGGELIDTKGNIINCSPSTAKMLGYKVPELIGKHITELLDSDSQKVFKKKMPNLLSGKPVSAEICMIRKDGVKVNIMRSAVPILSNSNKVESILAINMDITEQKQSEEALRIERDNLKNIFEAMEDGVYIVDQKHNIQYVNQVLIKDFGLYEGRKCYEYFNTRKEACPWCRNSEVFAGKTVRWEFTTAKNQKTYELIDTPLKNPDGSVSKLEILRDITERKQAEKVMLEASRMEVTATLAAGIAHDFNNLMVGVLGYAELLKIQYDKTPGAVDMINSITYSASKAGDLAQQLLAFARGGKYQPKVMNLNDTIQETLRLNERSFPPRIRIERDFDPVLLNILADPSQMSQVVTNLCINSIEAIEKNGRIIITTRNIDIDEKFAASHSQLKVGRHVYLSVEDTGCGMDKNTLLKIFEPFFSTKFQGRGLGLAAVYGIVKNHEGYISSYSEVGRGASFKIYLPAVESEIPLEHKLQKNDISGIETILIIDDEEMVLDITKKILERFGYHVLLAHNGQEAVDLVQSFDGEIHLALLDMGMPILGGAEAFPLIRKARPDIKIIICSGYELDAAAQSLLDNGAELFIQKPFKMQTLFKDIRKTLDSNKN